MPAGRPDSCRHAVRGVARIAGVTPSPPVLDGFFDRRERRTDAGLWSVCSAGGVVVTAHYLATAAGVEMLEAGGNAVDAAVAASLALGVCEPAGSGLGGMAMMVVHTAADDRTRVLPGPCRAPTLATPAAVAAVKNRYRGLRSVALPGYLKVMDAALARHGTFTPGEVAGPAIRMAEKGFPLTHLQHDLIAFYRRSLRRGSARSLFLDDSGNPLAPGTRLLQPALGATLRRLAEAGFDDFYRGEIAAVIDEDMRRRGGFVRAADLAAMPPARETEPVRGTLGETTVVTAGPPAGGIALAAMCNVFSRAAARGLDPDSPDAARLFAEVIRRGRADRRRYRLRTGTESPGESRRLLETAHASAAARRIAARLGRFAAPGETSHLCAVDAAGNVVSLTQSIERSFGAAELTPALGFLHNGFLRAFKVKNPLHPHYLRPLVAARSNASPAVMVVDGRVAGAVGNTGSERLASGILQVLVRLGSQTPFEAVLAPRLHCTPAREVLLEERFDDGVRAALSAAGYTLTPLEPYSFRAGGLSLLWRDGEGFTGVAEPRRDGAALSPRHA